MAALRARLEEPATHRRIKLDSAASFGLWLRQRRRALGLTHAALAESAHCSVSALRKIEQDERRPSHRLAERLAACLQVDAAERARFVEVARSEQRVERLVEVSSPALAPLPATRNDVEALPRPALRSALSPLDESMPSIAVLPFANLSTDAANEHFADGLAEELLNVLAKVPGLRVASRTSAFSFKGKDVDIPTLAQKLNVVVGARGQRAQVGEARAHHGAAGGGGHRLAPVVAVL